MKTKLSEKIDESISKLCSAIARQSVREITKHINELPVPNDIKTSMLFTIEIAMLDASVEGLHPGIGPEAMIERKLELLDIVKENWLNKEKNRDTR